MERLEPRHLLSAGDLDASFGAGGKVTADFSASANDHGNDLLIEPDGRYVVVGTVESSAGFSEDAGFAFARYNPDGTLDPTFGNGGKVVVPFGRYGAAAAAALAPGGKIVAAGTTVDSGGPLGRADDFALVRLNPDGTLDTTFDGDGRQTIDFGGRADEATDVVVLGDGRIVAIGRANDARPGGSIHNVLARLLPDGSLDPSFGTGGRVELTVQGHSINAAALALDGAGRLLAAGSGKLGTDAQNAGGFVVVRLADNGSLDPTFGTGGAAQSASGGTASGIAIDASGRIVIAGLVAGGDVLGGEVAVARHLPDGTVDLSFGGGDGFATIGLGPRNDFANDVAVDAAGNIVVVGGSDFAGTSGGGNAAVFRLDPSGTPDPTFDGDGAWLGNTSWSRANAAAPRPDGSVVVAGETRPGLEDYNFYLARFDAAGRLDPAFGNAGEALTDFAGYTRNEAGAAVVQPDGKVIVGGTTTLSDDDWSRFDIVRYAADGTPDPSFGAGGRAAAVPGLRRSALYAVALQSDGKILAAGQGWDASGYGGAGKAVFAVARYNADGSPDASFGNGGLATVTFDASSPYPERARSMALQDDGRILLAGEAEYNFAVGRLTPTGAPDATFGTGGKLIPLRHDPGAFGGFAYITDMGLGPAGKITVAGPIGSDYTPSSAFAVARFDSAGLPDATFGTGGLVTQDVRGSDDDVKLAVAPDGGVYLGTTRMTYSFDTGWSDADFALLRLRPDGTRDPYFGDFNPGLYNDDPDKGLATIDFSGGDDVLHALLLLPDGTLLAAGSTAPSTGGTTSIFDYDGPPSDFGLARLSADGMPMNAFGSSAKVTTDIAGSDDRARAVALAPNGRVVVVGSAVVARNATDFAVARYVLDEPPPPVPWLRRATVFYNNSAFDGHDDRINPSDDDAVAPDKFPLLPGQTPGAANVTSYPAGINGVMLDVGYAPGREVQWSARVADRSAPGGWRDAPPAESDSREAPSAPLAERHTLTWPDGTIRNTWLEMTVDVYLDGAVVEHNIFAFGNLIGDTGGDGRVNALDLGTVKRLLNTTAGPDSPADVNRDGKVNALDLGIVMRYLNQTLSAPVLSEPPAQSGAPFARATAPLRQENEGDMQVLPV